MSFTVTPAWTIGILIVLLFVSQNVKAFSVDHQDVSRRDWLLANAAGVTILLPPQVSRGAEQPIAVLGASGRTGALCVTACLKRGIPVKALTRSGIWTPPDGTADSNNNNNNLLTVAACDVKDSLALAASIKGCRAVIYAASASKLGGNPQEIDNLGVVRAGNVCLAQQIPRYVVLSSTATTRPKSLGYIFTNLSVNGIMDQKRLGEQGVQAAYQQSSSNPAACSYTIVRPGGLEEPKENKVLGPCALEVTQGDVLAGIVSRADLAEFSVELAASTAPNLRNTALELYYADSTVPVAREFKSMTKSGAVPRLHGDTYSQLLEGVRPNIDYYVPS